MGHDFEQSRPDHQIHHKRIPEGHAHMDQKYDKGMRSPMASQLPTESGLSNPETDTNLNGGMGSFGE